MEYGGLVRMIHTSFQIGIFSLFFMEHKPSMWIHHLHRARFEVCSLVDQKTALDIESQVSSFIMSKVMKSEVHSSAIASTMRPLSSPKMVVCVCVFFPPTLKGS